MNERTQSEIDEQMNLAADGENDGSKYPGMSYEQGVKAALEWVTGITDTKPMED